MKKYLFSLLIQDVVWPSHKGEIVFETLGNVTVKDTPVKWTSSLKLELILTNLSYYHAFFLENPSMGRIDVFSRSKARELVGEVDLMLLFREFRVFYLHNEGSALSESFLPGSFIHKTIRRFSIDDWVWDARLGGFLKEEGVAFDIEVPNMSIIYAYDDNWSELVKSKIRETIEPWKIRGLLLRTTCNIIIDELAPSIDFRILNMDFLNSIEFLRMNPTNYKEWVDRCAVHEAFNSPQDFLYIRKSIEDARANGKYCVNPQHLQWRSSTWNQNLMLGDFAPIADWKFLVYTNPLAWANMLPHSMFAISRLYCPEAFGIIMSNAIRLPLDVRGLIIRSHFITPTPAEKMVAARFLGHDLMMQSFGLHFVNGKWSSKPSMLTIHKRNHVLGSNFIDACFDGFAKEAAHKLLSAKEECTICSTDPSTTLLDNCGHVFCEPCIKSHITFGGDSCPICRARLDTWTTIKRSTERCMTEELISKKDYLESWPLDDDTLIVVPNAVVAEQVAEWMGHDIDLVMLDAAIKKKYGNIVLTTSLLKTSLELGALHRIFQAAMRDGTVLHVFMDEAAPPWLEDFSMCYKGIMQISVYR
jgi:hypothetical protein